MDGHRPVVLVTGASGGIGADLARVFAREGHDLALVARSADKLEALAGEIEAMGRMRPFTLSLDLAQPQACDALALALDEAGLTPFILINNAGFGLAGRAAMLERAGQIEMIDLNIRALTELTLRFLPAVIAGRGRIMNVASVAGFLPGPGMAVYYATKAYVVSFSQALSQELEGAGVTVTALCPGVTATDFHARAGLDANLMKNLPSMSSRVVAEAGYKGLMKGRRLVVPGLFNKLVTGLLPLMPNGLLLPVMGRMQDRRKGT